MTEVPVQLSGDDVDRLRAALDRNRAARADAQARITHLFNLQTQLREAGRLLKNALRQAAADGMPFEVPDNLLDDPEG
jgi:hypothetical protein